MRGKEYGLMVLTGKYFYVLWGELAESAMVMPVMCAVTSQETAPFAASRAAVVGPTGG